MIHIVKRASDRKTLFLLFDDMKDRTYKIASIDRDQAKATIRRASFAPESDWLDAATLDQALAALAVKPMRL